MQRYIADGGKIEKIKFNDNGMLLNNDLILDRNFDNESNVLEKLQEYQDMGIRSFILSGYPNREECKIFGELVMPHLKTCALAEVQNRVPKEEPDTPLAGGKRK